ncbi:MAG TPA: hypothetical protein VEW47_03690 [Candidatus Dormibacteraeota bacterium]|nr:hypothetical protein [Candidatus Dormibacteraeota bacterium]
MQAGLKVLILVVLLLIVSAQVSVSGRATAGVKYGDAVPGVVRPSDLEKIKRALRLDRFSIIAAVRLGAEEGREVIVSEPLPDGTLKKVKDACDAGGFCPDPVGFVASRVRIVLLQDKDVQTLVVLKDQVLGTGGKLVRLRDLGVEGEILGWNGRPDASDGHIALSLTPITENEGGVVAASLDPPLLIRFNPEAGRFQVFDCVAGDGGEPDCAFLGELGD